MQVFGPSYGPAVVEMSLDGMMVFQAGTPDPSGAHGASLLLETGSYLLLETADTLLLE